MSYEYPKIETLFNRDETFKVIEGEYRLPEFKLLKDIQWYVTEKVDGTNVRVIYEPTYQDRRETGSLQPKYAYTGYTIQFAGHTDKAQIHPLLLEYLERTFTAEKLGAVFPSVPEKQEYPRICLYGEGYGPKIQSGGIYRKDISVRLFDVFIVDELNYSGGWWLEPDKVADIASKLGLKTMPVLGAGMMADIISSVKCGSRSVVAIEENLDVTHSFAAPFMEGVVARTKPMLFTRRGERVIWKLKTKDFIGNKKVKT